MATQTQDPITAEPDILTVMADVTQAHIIHGLPGVCLLCPMALAVNAALDRRFVVSVAPSFIYLREPQTGKANYCCAMPPSARYFMNDVDTARDVKPATFTLQFERVL